MKMIGMQNVLEVPDQPPGPNKIYCLLPTKQNHGLETAWRSAVYRIRKAQDPSYHDISIEPDEHEDLETLCRGFEHLVYECNSLDWMRMWAVVTKIHLIESDAYYSIGTILVVVVEMQMFKEIHQEYDPIVYKSSAIENMAKLLEYGISSKSSDTEIIDTIKYAYRSLYSLQRSIGQPSELDRFLYMTRIANINRANTGFVSTDEFKSYKTALDRMIKMIRTRIDKF
jgi:hypothetical protein